MLELSVSTISHRVGVTRSGFLLPISTPSTLCLPRFWRRQPKNSKSPPNISSPVGRANHSSSSPSKWWAVPPLSTHTTTR